MKKTRLLCQRLVTFLMFVTLWTSLSVAQVAPPPPDASKFATTRSWHFEALIVIVMFGIALYVVCRSSRRN